MLPLNALLMSLVFLIISRMVVSRERTCAKSKRFEFVEEGFALSNHGITSLKVDSPIDCGMECTAILECNSFNFNVTARMGTNCELSDATRNSSSSADYKETAGLVYYEASPEGCLSSPCKNLARCTESCSADSSFRCDCIHDGTYGDRCEFWTDDAHDNFHLHFPSNDTSNFIVFNGKIQALDEFTICLWLQTTARNTLSLFSYGTAFYLQCSETGKCVLGIEGNESAFYIPPLNDGNWHQLCLSRKAANGSLKIFLDGVQGISGKGSKNAARIFLGRGQLIIGQKKMLSGQSFDGSSSFKGNISHFNIWSHWRNISEELVSSVHKCSTGEFGDQVDWRLLKVKNGIRGDVQVNKPGSCTGNSSSNESPSARFATGNIIKSYNITATITQALTKFTICAWMKINYWEQNGLIWTFSQNQVFDLLQLRIVNEVGKFEVRGQTIRKIDFPLVDNRSHFMCTLWEGTTGHLEVMVDGKVTRSGEIADKSVINITAGSTLFIGKDLGGKTYKGYISGVNIWDTLLEKHCIVALYHGNGRESGTLVSWSEVNIPGPFKASKLLNIEEEHKEQESEFTLDFKTRSSQNFANHTIDFPEMTKLSACAWFKTKEQGAIFQFVSTHDSTRHNFHVLVTMEGNLAFKFGPGDIQEVTNLYLTDDQWHHVCLHWSQNKKEATIFCDGENVFKINLQKDIPLTGSGDFVIGQYMNISTRRFTIGHEFVGKITGVTVWDRLFAHDVYATMSRDCRSGGNNVRWREFRDSYHGDVQLIESSECLLPDFAVLSRRDDRCNERYTIQSLSCSGPMRALFDRNNSTSGKMWRCYHECALEKSSIDGSFIFNQASGREECITDAHSDLLAIR